MILKSNPADLAGNKKISKIKISFIADKGVISLGILLAIILGLSWWALNVVQDQIKTDLKNSLQVAVGTTQEAMLTWTETRLEDAQLLADRPDFQVLVSQLLSTPRTKKALSQHPAQTQLRNILGPLLERKSDQGIFIINPEGINVGSMRDENLGTSNLIKDVGDYFQNLKAGKPQLVLPMRSDVVLPDLMGMLQENEPTMFIGLPVFDQNRNMIAIFTIRINPSRDFSQIVHIARFGKSGDSYAFDKYGKLISECRFEDQLRELGLLGMSERSILNLMVKDPGGNMLEGYRPTLDRDHQPLTLMAQSATSGKSGVNLEGYRDYRGVPVVGAWIWLEKYQYGLTFELDVAEAYQSYYFLRRLMVFLLSSITVLFIVYSIFTLRSRRKTELINLQLDKARLEAESAAKTKSEFLANMSHEIRTPLNAVIGFSELMGALVVDLTQKSYLKSIQSAGKSLLTLINDILDLSKIEAGKMALKYEDINLKSLLKEINQIFSLKIAEKKLALNIETDLDVPEMLILDEIRLRQIMLNLVGNAVKFTHQGTVSISVSQTGLDLENRKTNLVIEVRDTGIGIPENQQASIFDSFKQQDGQSNRKYGGTGLGLSISKRLVEIMNGSISVQSIINEGTVFIIELKDVSISELTTKQDKITKDLKATSPTFEKSKILVVDDVASNRYLMREVLKKFGLSVSEAENGHQALLMMFERIPDLILMDLRMSVMDGYQATEILKSDPHTRHIPIVALTASINMEEKDKVMESGFDGFLTKPIDSAALVQELSRFLQKIEPKAEMDGSAAEATNHQTIDSPADLTALIARLESEFMPKWESLQGAIDMEETKRFAESLLDMAEIHKSNSLEDFSRKLILYIDAFEIDKIQPQFAAFIQQIDLLKKLL